MSKPKVKMGLLLDDYTVPAWIYRMLEEIRRGDYAELSLVVLNAGYRKPERRSLLAKIRNNYRHLGPIATRRFLEIAYETIIERQLYLPDAAESMDCRSLLDGVPVLEVSPIQERLSDRLKEKDIEVIRRREPDVLFRCGFRILRGEVLNAAKYGVWSFHHGDNRINRGGPAGFWETMERWPETGSILQILTEDLDNGKVISRSFSCTDGLSVTDNKSNYYWKSLFFVPRKLKEIYEAGGDKFWDEVNFRNRHPEFYAERLYKRPTNFQYARLVARKAGEKTVKVLSSRLWFDQWILMFHLKSEFSSSLWRYKPIVPPKDRFWADPHIIYKNNEYYIFIEEYLYASRKGHISLLRMDADGSYTEPEPLIDRPYHLSYPSVFEYDGDYFMIPESSGNGTIELYKCLEFPHKWEFQMNLIENVSAVDTTVLFHEGRWWLFTNMRAHSGASSWDELFLFSSPDLLTRNWQPHPRNPVVSDCKSARPAGRIFRMNGGLYRPSQNCSTRYGYGFNINEIIVLDESNYRESVVSSVGPNWDRKIVGTHTFNRAGSLHIIDALYRRKKW